MSETDRPHSDPHLKQVWRYYDRTESRVGYSVLLGGTRHFGWYDDGVSKWRFKAAMRRMEEILGDTLDLPPNSLVLDAGCGAGDVARMMATRFGLKVTGIDLVDFHLEEARRRSAAAGMDDRTTFKWGDYHHLDFPDASFDGVYTMETLVHSPRPKAVLEEFKRVLKPGGRLVMFEYSRTPEELLSPEAREAFRQVCDMAAMPGWWMLHHGDLEKLLTETGFNVAPTLDATDRMMPMLEAFSIMGKMPYALGRALGKTAKVVNSLSGVEMYRHREAWRYNIYAATKPEST